MSLFPLLVAEEAGEEFDQVLELRQEVVRPRELVEDIARWLRYSGHPVKAALVLKDLNTNNASIRPSNTSSRDAQGAIRPDRG